MWKRFLFISITLAFVFLSFQSVLAQDDAGDEPEVVVVLFWGEGCPHCAAEKTYLQGIMDQYHQVKLKDYEIYQNEENKQKLFSLGEALDFEVTGVPVTLIGDKFWIGFSENNSTEIENTIQACLPTGCPDPTEILEDTTSSTVQSTEAPTEAAATKTPEIIDTGTAQSIESQGKPLIFWIPLSLITVAVVAIIVLLVGKRKDKNPRKRH
jgi:glutaredoxin